MLNATFRPVERWPGKPKVTRKRSTFKAGYSDTLDLLERELDAVHARDVVIQAYFQRRDIRNDGWPKSSARPTGPGVIVTFLRGKETVSFPCDTFDDWQDNLRAVAKSLEALRLVDRYGVTSNGEQYSGFTALPPAPEGMTDLAAVQILNEHSGYAQSWILQSAENFQVAYRAAALTTHPDRNGGHHSLFVRVNEAKQVLERRFGGAR